MITYLINNFFTVLLKSILFFLFFVETIEFNKEKAAWRRALALTFFLGLSIFALVEEYAYQNYNLDLFYDYWCHTILKNLIILAGYFSYIIILKDLHWKTVLYYALFIRTICIAGYNIFLTPATAPLLHKTIVFFGDPAIDEDICVLLFNLFIIGIYYFVYKVVGFSQSRNIPTFAVILMSAIYVISIYFNSSIKMIDYMGQTLDVHFSVYLVVMQVLLIASVCYCEKYQNIIAKNMQVDRENQAINFTLQNVKRHQKNEESLRRLNHDFKNHLSILLHYARNNQAEEAISYINSLSDDFIFAYSSFNSGNEIIDGILAQKMNDINEQNIALSITADFSHLKHMEKADMCILFGNLIDNAIEGCLTVKDGVKYIDIREYALGDTVIYSMENSYVGKNISPGEYPSTSKKDESFHGIGLKSVNMVTEKYDGTLVFSGKDGIFKVICSFPIS